jgi:hypothetical protein
MWEPGFITASIPDQCAKQLAKLENCGFHQFVRQKWRFSRAAARDGPHAGNVVLSTKASASAEGALRRGGHNKCSRQGGSSRHCISQQTQAPTIDGPIPNRQSELSYSGCDIRSPNPPAKCDYARKSAGRRTMH